MVRFTEPFGRWVRGTRTFACSVIAASGCASGVVLLQPQPASAQDLQTIQAPSSGSRFSRTPNPVSRLVVPDNTQPLNLEGDELIYDSNGQTVTARGNVDIEFNNYTLKADEVVYNQGAGTLTAIGNVILRDPSGTITRGERITLTDDFRDGFVEALSVRTTDETRITARRAIRRDGQVSVFEDGKFTPCKTDGTTPPLWCISASRVVHDQAAGVISYENPAFELFGQPVLWLPFFQHADPSVKRKSGFLQPGFAFNSDLGVGISSAYYFALSPSYDFTFAPTYYTDQGLMYAGVWRQKVAFAGIRGEYSVNFAAIDQNGSALPGNDTAENEELDGFRGTVETKGRFSLSSWWQFGWDATFQSDDSFRRFYQFDSVLAKDQVNVAYLIGQSERNYFSIQGYHLGALGFTETLESESRVHPVLDWNYIYGQPVVGGELSFNVNAVSLSRDVDLTSTDQQTSSHQRVSAIVNWRRRLTDTVGITYEPFANLRGDFFSITDGFNGRLGAGSNDVADYIDSQNLARGVASAGVLAEYPWLARTTGASHVIAPIGQFIARTEAGDDQEELPNEDAQSLVFDDTNLFEVDKFSGFDRVETGSRVNVGLQYTFQADWGGHARILAGQSFRISSDNPFANPGQVPVVGSSGNVSGTENYIPADSGLETAKSDYVLGMYLSPSTAFRLIGQARFDDADFDLRQANIWAQASAGPFTASLSYAFLNNELAREALSDLNDVENIYEDQQDIIGRLAVRLDENWTVSGSVRYDIDRAFLLQDTIQVQYSDECFVLSVSYQGSFIEDAENDIEQNSTIMLRFDLKHLGQFQTTSNLSALFDSDNEE